MSTSSERHFEKALNRCRPELLEKLQQGGLIVRLLAHLHEDNDGYLSECEVLDIKALQGRDKVWEFLDCTKNKDKTAFEKLCRALTKLGMSHLANCLKEAETYFKLGTVDSEPDEPREPPKDCGKSSVHPTVTGPFMERVPERKECNGEPAGPGFVKRTTVMFEERFGGGKLHSPPGVHPTQRIKPAVTMEDQCEQADQEEEDKAEVVQLQRELMAARLRIQKLEEEREKLEDKNIKLNEQLTEAEGTQEYLRQENISLKMKFKVKEAESQRHVKSKARMLENLLESLKQLQEENKLLKQEVQVLEQKLLLDTQKPSPFTEIEVSSGLRMLKLEESLQDELEIGSKFVDLPKQIEDKPQHKLINAFAQTEVNLEATTLVHCQTEIPQTDCDSLTKESRCQPICQNPEVTEPRDPDTGPSYALKGAKWTREDGAIGILQSPVAVYVDGLVVVGDRQELGTDLHIFNPFTDGWKSISFDGGCQRTAFTLTAAKGVLHLIGGDWLCKTVRDAFTKDVVSLSDIKFTPQWSRRLPPLKTGRADPGAITIGNHILVFGGISDQFTLLSSIELLNTSSPQPQWMVVGNLPTPSYHLQAAVTEDSIFVGFGKDTEDKLYQAKISEVEAVVAAGADLDSIWRENLPCSPFKRSGLGYVNGHLIAVGGCDSICRPVVSVFAFDPSRNAWDKLCETLEARKWPAIAPVPNNKIYIFGGTPSSGHGESCAFV